MNLDNFEQQIDPKIVDRGYDYFMHGLVYNLENVSHGMWRAKVNGTVPYQVEIHVEDENDREIKSWQCSCPYDYGPVCKHVAATLFAMVEVDHTEWVNSLEKPQTTRFEKIKTIFKNTSKDELREFILSSFDKVEGFENHFWIHFADRLDVDTDRKYRIKIKNYIQAAKGSDGFIDYYSVDALINPLWELNQKAADLIKTGKMRESVKICRTLIEEVAGVMHYIDHSDGSAGQVMEQAFDFLMFSTDRFPNDLRDELFTWCLQEYSLEKYRDFGFESYFLEILADIVTSDKQEKQFLDLLNRQIDEGNHSSNFEYRNTRLIKTKIRYFQRVNRDKEVLELLEQNKDFYEIRRLFVDRKLEEEDFDVAKNLCHEGITLAKKKSHPGIVTQWKEKLYRIAELQNDVPEMRKWAEKLLFGGFAAMRWYRLLKSTYPENEWEARREEIIQHIQDKNNDKYSASRNMLEQIFVEEEFTDRLLKLIQPYADIHTIDQFAAELQEEYPREVLELYEQGISNYAHNTGRKHYRKITGWLHNMKKITGGDEWAYRLYKKLLRDYNNRPAMRDEFFKAFPEWATMG